MKTLTDKDIDTLCEYLQGLKGRGIRLSTSGKNDTYQIDHGTHLETKLLAQRVVLEIDIPPAKELRANPLERSVPILPKLGSVIPMGTYSMPCEHFVWTVQNDAGKWIATGDSVPAVKVHTDQPELGLARSCPECKGSGQYRGLIAIEPCRKCSGTGKDCT